MTPLNELTREKILAMEAGREMDAYVAEARGWKIPDAPKPDCPECGADIDRPKCMLELGGGCPRHDAKHEWESAREPFPCSADIAEAFELVPEMRKRWSRVEIHSVDDVYLCQVEVNSGEWNERYVVTDETGTPSPPLAICRAFLLATLEIEE